MIQIEEAVVKSQGQFKGLQEYVRTAAERPSDAHVVEQGIWDRLLQLGQALLTEYVARQGRGDMGETLTLSSGEQLSSVGLHTRRYVSVFGAVSIERMCYGRGKIEAVPLDARLNLPPSEYSYLLQDWSQSFAVHDAYGETVVKVERLLHLGLSVRTLENLNRDIAKSVEGFHQVQPTPDPATEGALIVAAVDGKGVPICREKPKEDNGHHRRKKGEKANKKKMACVGAVYTIEPFCRTADDVLDEVMRKKAQKQRPVPQNKHVQAHLVEGKEATFGWIAQQVAARNPIGKKPLVCLCDGEKALWTCKREHLKDAIEVLDLFHVTEKLWLAAHCFHKEGSAQADLFVEHRLRMLLEGKTCWVISGLKQMATKHHLKGVPKKTIEQVTGYFQCNEPRMRYDVYLAKGYPIGSGVAEGACRHLVKDRLERTGMRWTLQGAQAMLDLRATYLNDEWEPFWKHHIKRQNQLLYGQITSDTLEQLSKAA